MTPPRHRKMLCLHWNRTAYSPEFPERDEFVNVEQQPRKVADEENEDETHEDGRQIVLETAPALVDVLRERERERR